MALACASRQGRERIAGTGLTNDATNRVVKRFETKDEAVKGGVLENAVGTGGGSVKIKKMDNQYQEERTYPGTADPKKSPG